MGELPPAAVPDDHEFDAALEQALARFQKRHFLDADGVVGEETTAALNVPVDARIEQLRVNLERARWVLHDLPSDYVLVDIAGFELTLVRSGDVVWRTRVQVGRPYRKTPVFKDEIRYLDFNPTWTIPPGILRRDTLPAVQRDPSYLPERNIRVIDAKGAEIDPHTLDWSRYSGRSLPYRLVQDPGPNNALGRVKFMFPNPHLVFLHDTPSRSLFDRSERAFSSGCIRVERPFELAELLLDDQAKWNASAIRRVVDSRKTRTVFLPERVTVILLYWTVNFWEDGSAGFKRDLYGRDAAVLAGLAKDFQLHESRRGAE
jgi:murein L,D-transpeptidase YcbB/YkuD